MRTHGPRKSTLGLFRLLVSPSGFPVTCICLYLIFSRKMFKTGYGKELGGRGLCKRLVDEKPRTTKIFYLPLLIPILVSFLLLEERSREQG